VIYDTPALSGWAESFPDVIALVRGDSHRVIPMVTLGEYEFGIKSSRNSLRYQQWLEGILPICELRCANRKTAAVYAALYHHLKTTGQLIQQNDVWIAAHALELGMPVVSNDSDFDRIEGLVRIGFDDPRKKDHKPLPKA